MMAPILISATNGDRQTMEILIKNSADLKASKVTTNETILHCYLQQNSNRDLEELESLLNHSTEDVRLQITEIINKKDVNGNTALHIAAQKWPQEAIRSLLEAGANVGMKNQWNEPAITQILPETFEAFLNEHCVKSNHADIHQHDFELTFDYR